MIIDFHTHMFPDKIAARTIDFLSKTGGDMNPFTDGTWRSVRIIYTARRPWQKKY